jgi:hypothetical protein
MDELIGHVATNGPTLGWPRGPDVAAMNLLSLFKILPILAASPARKPPK